MITAGGENIAPVLIEQTVISKIPVVSHAVLVADGRKFVSLLITLKVIDLTNDNPLLYPQFSLILSFFLDQNKPRKWSTFRRIDT